jgi:hypothetical protein
MENRLLEAEQLLKLLKTTVAQAKEVVLITSAQRSKFKYARNRQPCRHSWMIQ